MMRVAQRKTRLVFETDDFIFERGRRRQIVIEARPSYCILRLKGQRRAISICYAAVYGAAIELELEAKRREKRLAKKGGRK